MDPRSMAKMMKQFGIKTEAVDAEEVIIKKKDGTELVIVSPDVNIMDIQGERMIQVSGKITVREGGPSKEDVDLVMSQSKCTREKAIIALKKANGDIAAAILATQES